MRPVTIFTAFLLLALPAVANPPRVATDIAPVHSLVAQVMAGIGTPDLIVTSAASHHGAALRPSQASALANADLVVWIGPVLSPWLDSPVASLAPNAKKLTLLALPATRTLSFRTGFEDGDDHRNEAAGTDPHAWLDPGNAMVWIDAIAKTLAELDADNAGIYRQNARLARTRLAALTAELEVRLQPVKGTRFVVVHDAFHYFEDRFGLGASGAFSLSDATPPSARRAAEIRRIVQETGIACAFAEPQFDTRLVESVTGEGGLRIGILDPMGTVHSPGPDLYASVLTDMADAFLACQQDAR